MAFHSFGTFASEWDQNQRFAVDLSSRALHDFDDDRFATIQFIGIDYLKIFSNARGDWGTLLLQPYITRIDNLTRHPRSFDDEDDTELIFRHFYFNYTGLSRGKFNIRLGHFEIPFGLEQVINTNGTIHDFIHGSNIGVKADWGISLNGILPNLEYDFALTRATGNEWKNQGNPYFISGRIGSSAANNFIVGVSALEGELYTGRDKTLSRSRLGIDFQWFIKSFTLMGDFSIGKDEDTDIFNSLLEVDWHNLYETLIVYVQYKRFSKKVPDNSWDELNTVSLGARYEPDNHWQFDAQLNHDFSTIGDGVKRDVLALQIRYRF